MLMLDVDVLQSCMPQVQMSEHHLINKDVVVVIR
jgi:hypothetical protein